MPKSPAQLKREIAEALASTKAQSRARKSPTFEQTYKRGVLEDAIEAVYHRLRKGDVDLTLAEACEAVRELLPHANWSRNEVSDKTITVTIKRQIPNWF